MADSRARVRVFSDDGTCVARRAADAPGAGVRQGVRRRHRPARRRTRGSPSRRACCTRASSPAGSACPAGRRSPRRRSSPATCCSPRHTGSRLHVCHVSTAGSVEVLRWAKAPGHRASPPRSPRTTCCSPTTCSSATTRSSRSTRRCAPTRTSRRCATALADGTIDAVATDHAPHAAQDKEREWVDAAARDARAGDRAVGRGQRGHGRRRAARLGRRRRRVMSRAPGPRSAGLDRPRPRRSRPARRPTSRSSTRPRRWTVDRDALASRCPATRPYAGRELPGARRRDVPARARHGRSTAKPAPRVRTGARADRRRPRPRGRPDLPRRVLRRRRARPSARRCSPPA